MHKRIKNKLFTFIQQKLKKVLAFRIKVWYYTIRKEQEVNKMYSKVINGISYLCQDFFQIAVAEKFAYENKALSIETRQLKNGFTYYRVIIRAE